MSEKKLKREGRDKHTNSIPMQTICSKLKKLNMFLRSMLRDNLCISI